MVEAVSGFFGWDLGCASVGGYEGGVGVGVAKKNLVGCLNVGCTSPLYEMLSSSASPGEIKATPDFGRSNGVLLALTDKQLLRRTAQEHRELPLLLIPLPLPLPLYPVPLLFCADSCRRRYYRFSYRWRHLFYRCKLPLLPLPLLPLP